MNFPNRPGRMGAVFSMLLLLSPMVAAGQNKGSETKDKSNSGTTRLTIVVTAGTNKKPVDNASVYVRFVETRILLKDKKIEMDLKTNLSGICHSPEIPRGKILVQIVAPGWKTFGRYYQVEQAERTIKINLDPPPKWY
jgi:hypothetical protein